MNEGGGGGCFSAQGKRINRSFQVWPHSSGRNTAILTGSSSSTLGGGGGVGGIGGGGVARELSVSSERQGGGGRNPRPYSGSRYKYLGELAENLKNVRLRRTLYTLMAPCSNQERLILSVANLVVEKKNGWPKMVHIVRG